MALPKSKGILLERLDTHADASRRCEDCGGQAEFYYHHKGCPFCGGCDCLDYPEDVLLCRVCAERDGSLQFPVTKGG